MKDWRKITRARYGDVLYGNPHIQSPAALAKLIYSLSARDETIYDKWKWNAFLKAYFSKIDLDKMYCFHCGKKLIKDEINNRRSDSPTLDHIIPLSTGINPYDESNIELSCYDCNTSRINTYLKP